MKRRRKKDRVLLNNDRPVFLVLPANIVTPNSREKRSCKYNRHATPSKGCEVIVQVHCPLLEEKYETVQQQCMHGRLQVN